MKKILSLIFVSLMLSGNAYADRATCFAGSCDFFPGIWYEYAETNCMDNLLMEEVDQDAFGFTIIETGDWCMVFNER